MPDMEEKTRAHWEGQSKEKDIALAIALKTGKYIEENIEGVKVIYTRKRMSLLNYIKELK